MEGRKEWKLAEDEEEDGSKAKNGMAEGIRKERCRRVGVRMSERGGGGYFLLQSSQLYCRFYHTHTHCCKKSPTIYLPM